MCCMGHVFNPYAEMPDGVMVAHGPLEARVKVRVLVGQPLRGTAEMLRFRSLDR